MAKNVDWTEMRESAETVRARRFTLPRFRLRLPKVDIDGDILELLLKFGAIAFIAFIARYC